MQITDQAKERLQSLMQAHNAQGLLGVWVNACNGRRPLFRLCVFEEGDNPVTINEIRVLIPEDMQQTVEDATLELYGKSLILENFSCSCEHACHKKCPY